MVELKTNEMYEVTGGGLSWAAIAGICAGIVYLIGLVDGYLNPQKCNN